jgi:hypothetical protein
MDPKLFQQRLSQLAKIKRVRLANKPSRGVTCDGPIEIARPDLTVTLTYDDNPTIAVEIKEVLHEPRPCEGCDQTVVNRIVDRKRFDWPQPHWRDTCKNCGLTYNPQSDRFDIDLRFGNHKKLIPILHTTNRLIKITTDK